MPAAASPWGAMPMPTQAQLNQYFQAPQGSGWPAPPPGGDAFVGPPAAAAMPPPVVMDQAATLSGAPVAPAAPPVPRGTFHSTETTGTAPNAGATQALLDALGGSQLDSLKKQGLTTDALQAKLKALEGKDLPLNFGPIAGLVDSWTGSHMAGAVAPPETAAGRDAQVQKLQDAIMKSQQGMSQDEISYMKDKLSAQYHAEDIAGRHADRQIQREGIQAQKDAMLGMRQEKRDQDLLTHATDKFNSDATVVDATKKIGEVSNASQMLDMARTNPAVRNTIALDMARLIVPSRLNETEIAAFGGSKAASDKIDQMLSDMKGGTLSDTNYGYLKQMVAALGEHDKKVLSDRLEHHATQFAARSSYTKDEAAQAIGGTAYPAPAAAGGGGFPKTLSKGGKTATVGSASELAEAQAEGWK